MGTLAVLFAVGNLSFPGPFKASVCIATFIASASSHIEMRQLLHCHYIFCQMCIRRKQKQAYMLGVRAFHWVTYVAMGKKTVCTCLLAVVSICPRSDSVRRACPELAQGQRKWLKRSHFFEFKALTTCRQANSTATQAQPLL